MIISLVVAMGTNRVIGANGRLPWPYLAEDVRWFYRLTVGKPVIMGRRTYESLPAGPLPNRTNIVLTTDRQYAAPGCILAHSADEALAAAGDAVEVMVIGGTAVYEQFLPLAETIYLTRIAQEFCGTAFFPAYDLATWTEEVVGAGEQDGCRYEFVNLRRVTVDCKAVTG